MHGGTAGVINEPNGESEDQPTLGPLAAGPFIHYLKLSGLGGIEANRVARRAVLAALVAWLPLVALAAVQGLALRPDPRESLLLDVSIASRYLLALPLLIAADAVCLPALARILRHFRDSGLIAETSLPRFDALVQSTRRLVKSPGAELVLVALAYVGTLALGSFLYPETVSTWVVPLTNGVGRLSLAGWWRALVSQPLFLVVQLAWLWRILLWARLLWGISHMELRLVPSHPDLAGGLGFTVASLRAFSMVALGLAVSVAGTVAENVLHRGEPLQAFRIPVGGFVALMLVLFAGPLLFLAFPLLRAQPRGRLQYGALATAMGQEFERRWLQPGTVNPESLAVQDFSATTDLYSIASNVYRMRIVPLDLRSLIPLALATVLPFVPVILVALPFKQVLELVGKLLR
jgi:hypothetical protein